MQSGWGGQGDRERTHSLLSVKPLHGVPPHEPEMVTCAETTRQTLSQPSHPGTPETFYFISSASSIPPPPSHWQPPFCSICPLVTTYLYAV